MILQDSCFLSYSLFREVWTLYKATSSLPQYHRKILQLLSLSITFTFSLLRTVMALRKTLTKRLLNCKNAADAAVISSLLHSPAAAGNRLASESAARLNFHRELLTSPDGKVGGFFRRFLHRRAIIQAAKPPEFASATVGEKLWPINISSGRLRLDGLVPPPPVPEDVIGGISVTDARKILRSYQLQKVRLRIREIPVNSVSYSDFVQICSDACNNREQGLEFAKTLDQSGSVIVLGDVVLLRPDKVNDLISS